MSRPSLLAAALAALLLTAGAQARKAPPSPLAVLEGRWTGTIAGVASQALPVRVTYTAPEGGQVLGTTKVLNAQATRAVYFEFERFQAEGQTARLFPYPGGEAATPFRATTCAADRLVFEHPTKDWPRRLRYERPAPNRLVITADRPGTRVLKLELRRAR